MTYPLRKWGSAALFLLTKSFALKEECNTQVHFQTSSCNYFSFFVSSRLVYVFITINFTKTFASTSQNIIPSQEIVRRTTKNKHLLLHKQTCITKDYIKSVKHIHTNNINKGEKIIPSQEMGLCYPLLPAQSLY